MSTGAQWHGAGRCFDDDGIGVDNGSRSGWSGVDGVVGMGVASAQPDLSPLIDTTCSYSQIEAALNAQAPDLAQELSSHPQAQTKLKQFLALPIDQRRQAVQQVLASHPQWLGMIDDKAGGAEGQEIMQVASTCHGY